MHSDRRSGAKVGDTSSFTPADPVVASKILDRCASMDKASLDRKAAAQENLALSNLAFAKTLAVREEQERNRLPRVLEDIAELKSLEDSPICVALRAFLKQQRILLPVAVVNPDSPFIPTEVRGLLGGLFDRYGKFRNMVRSEIFQWGKSGAAHWTTRGSPHWASAPESIFYTLTERGFAFYATFQIDRYDSREAGFTRTPSGFDLDRVVSMEPGTGSLNRPHFLSVRLKHAPLHYFWAMLHGPEGKELIVKRVLAFSELVASGAKIR